VKSLDEFGSDRSRRDGREYKCKTCVNEEKRRRYWADPGVARERARRYHQANREAELEYKRRYREANPEAIREYSRRYYEENLEKERERKRRYLEANREASREYSRRWREENLEVAREYGREYARRRREASPEWAAMADERVRQWRARATTQVFGHYGTVCACCGTTEKLSIDHIVGGGEAHRKEVAASGGAQFYAWLIRNDFPTGYQTLCVPCNTSKRDGECCRLQHGP